MVKWTTTSESSFIISITKLPRSWNFKRDFTGASGLFSFELHKRLNDEELSAFMDNFELFTMAYSWGGFESLILCNQAEEIAKIRPGIERKLTGSINSSGILDLKTRMN